MGLGSGILEKPIPDPGSRGQKGTVSWIRIRNTGLSRILIFIHPGSRILDRYHTVPKGIPVFGSTSTVNVNG